MSSLFSSSSYVLLVDGESLISEMRDPSVDGGRRAVAEERPGLSALYAEPVGDRRFVAATPAGCPDALPENLSGSNHARSAVRNERVNLTRSLIGESS